MLKSNLTIENRFSLIGTVVSQPKRHQRIFLPVPRILRRFIQPVGQLDAMEVPPFHVDEKTLVQPDRQDRARDHDTVGMERGERTKGRLERAQIRRHVRLFRAMDRRFRVQRRPPCPR